MPFGGSLSVFFPSKSNMTIRFTCPCGRRPALILCCVISIASLLYERQVWTPYQQEQQIVNQIHASGGSGKSRPVVTVDFGGGQGCRSSDRSQLCEGACTDADLAVVSRLPNLKCIRLGGCSSHRRGYVPFGKIDQA